MDYQLYKRRLDFFFIVLETLINAVLTIFIFYIGRRGTKREVRNVHSLFVHNKTAIAVIMQTIIIMFNTLPARSWRACRREAPPVSRVTFSPLGKARLSPLSFLHSLVLLNFQWYIYTHTYSIIMYQ